ncbi:capsule assembly Wzi family protein [Emcibacter sp.]|uniref:capsule assembly Wzi family protein n=1 Tax=Emcibacter sp. TaxID=1979954 RepID=UPI002AA83369|nr:capsule assembly Wzi family protein [Emcibacter sp.]
MQLRNDVELLARYDLITGPVGTWPMTWKHITRNLHRADEMELPGYVRMALLRVKEKMPGEWQGSVRLQATTEPEIVRGFEATARNDFDSSASLQYNGESTTVNISGGYRNGNGEDYAHLDGSYLAQELGNWQLYAGAIDRWWGPGREGTLLLSNNARPMPSIGFMRSEPQPFQTKWLSWMGPWQLRLFLAKMEEDRYVPNALIAGMSLTFEPVENWEVGLRRTLQLCGDDRPCNGETWARALIGGGDLDNNRGEPTEPGNQLAQIDMAYSFGIGKDATLKFYAEATAEDEAGKLFLPKRFARLLGATAYGPWGESGAQWRVTAEYADTTSTEYWLFGDRRKNLIYEHAIYRTGYRFKGVSLGHTIDSDSRSIAFSAEYTSSHQWNYGIKYHNIELNDDSSANHSLTAVKKNISVFEAYAGGKTSMGAPKLSVRYYSDGLDIADRDSNFFSAGIIWEVGF